MTHAQEVIRTALVNEIHRLKMLQADTVNVNRNIANIERHTPIQNMNQDSLCSYINLLHRSIKK